MSDVKILKKDGWEELGDIAAAIMDRALDITALWNAAGRMDVEAAQQLLLDAGYDLKGTVKKFRLIAIPDDIRGESFRIWVNYR